MNTMIQIVKCATYGMGHITKSIMKAYEEVQTIRVMRKNGIKTINDLFSLKQEA